MILLAQILTVTCANAQSTTITSVSYTGTALFDIDTQTTVNPLIVNATVNYADVKPGYYLAAGVFGLDDGNLVSGLGSSSPQSCATTTQFAGCIILLVSTSGSERLQFLLTHPKSVWTLALEVAILDKQQNIVPNSFSDYTFTIEVHSALTLVVDVPNNVAVSVDGVNGSGGSVQLVLLAGNHMVRVPEIIQVSNDTRIKFTAWSDGSTEANRSVALNYDITLYANYVTQYRLQVISPIAVGGEGWYNAGSNVTLAISSLIVPVGGFLGVLGARWVFQGWSEDGHGMSAAAIDQLTMNSPHVVTAVWKPDYGLPLSIAAGLSILLALTVLHSRQRFRKLKRSRSHGSRKTARSKRAKRKLLSASNSYAIVNNLLI